jgi:two-component system, OmpR family, phosphate regulon response regulator PhoB
MPTQTILVMNHDPLFIDLMTTLLTEEGYQTQVQHHPHDAYARIKADHPDLVLLDLHLTDPQPSWTVLELMRLDPETTRIPVIVSSTDERFLREKEATLREHDTLCLPKPFNLDELLSMVTSLIGPPTDQERTRSDADDRSR